MFTMTTTHERMEMIKTLVNVECETYFQLTQQELADRLGIKQPTVANYKADPYYQQCITTWKQGRIANMQLKSAALVDRAIELGHESIPLIDMALDLVHTAPNKTERAAAFETFKRVLYAFQDGKDMAKWLLEKTDGAYSTKLEISNKDATAPADNEELTEKIGKHIDEKLATTTALVEFTTGPPDPDNGRSGNGNDP